MKPAAAIRSGDLKLIEWYEPKLLGDQNTYELYNLVKDPGETKDLSSKFPEKVNELKVLLNEWKIDVNAQEPSINQNYH
jgi:arylsulfatase A-like enzyme